MEIKEIEDAVKVLEMCIIPLEPTNKSVKTMLALARLYLDVVKEVPSEQEISDKAMEALWNPALGQRQNGDTDVFIWLQANIFWVGEALHSQFIPLLMEKDARIAKLEAIAERVKNINVEDIYNVFHKSEHCTRVNCPDCMKSAEAIKQWLLGEVER